MRRINWIPVTKEYWLRDIPALIQTLSGQYKFFWSKLCHHINDPVKLVQKKKDTYAHRMCLYRTEENLYFFAVYCKNKIDVYYLKDSYINSDGQRSYFINKWKQYYEQKIDEEEELW